MITAREYALILQHYGPQQAEQCALGTCQHGGHTDAPPMVDLRCPHADGGNHMGKLLGRTAMVAHPDGLIDLACNNCARAYRRAGVDAARVLHRFNLLGELIATLILPTAGGGEGGN
jgi:hypothetical protein